MLPPHRITGNLFSRWHAVITGIVNSKLQSIVPITVRGPQGQELTTDARIDTGFNGGLTLPPDLVASLGLISEFSDAIILANGDLINLATYRATLILDGTGRDIPVFATGDFPLLGMLSVVGYRICIDMQNGGAVTIKAKARKKR